MQRSIALIERDLMNLQERVMEPEASEKYKVKFLIDHIGSIMNELHALRLSETSMVKLHGVCFTVLLITMMKVMSLWVMMVVSKVLKTWMMITTSRI